MRANGWFPDAATASGRPIHCKHDIAHMTSGTLRDALLIACARVRAEVPVQDVMELPAGRTNTPQPTCPPQTASLATFRGDALTDLLAGLAANCMGSFVKGFTPLRASVAGLCTTDILAKPGMTNSPDSFSSL